MEGTGWRERMTALLSTLKTGRRELVILIPLSVQVVRLDEEMLAYRTCLTDKKGGRYYGDWRTGREPDLKRLTESAAARWTEMEGS